MEKGFGRTPRLLHSRVVLFDLNVIETCKITSGDSAATIRRAQLLALTEMLVLKKSVRHPSLSKQVALLRT